MHRRSGGATYGRYYFSTTNRTDQPTDIINLQTKIGQSIISVLETGIGGEMANITGGPGITAQKHVESQGNIWVTHRRLYRSREGGNIQVLEPRVILTVGYVKRPYLLRERLISWYNPGDLTQRMNEYQTPYLQEDTHLIPPTKVLASVLQAVTKSQPMYLNSSICSRGQKPR